MPAREHFYREPDPEPKPAPAPAPAVTDPAPKSGLSDSQLAHARLLLEATRRALNTSMVSEDQPPLEDPAVTRHREILTGEGDPSSPQELAGAARWALENRDQIED